MTIHLIIERTCSACKDFIRDMKKRGEKLPTIIEYNRNKKFIDSVGMDYVPAFIDIKKAKGNKVKVCIEGEKKPKCKIVKKRRIRTEKRY